MYYRHFIANDQYTTFIRVYFKNVANLARFSKLRACYDHIQQYTCIYVKIKQKKTINVFGLH